MTDTSRPWWRWPLCMFGMCGGRIERDPAGQINHQCATCKRWSTPVPVEIEQAVIEEDIYVAQQARVHLGMDVHQGTVPIPYDLDRLPIHIHSITELGAADRAREPGLHYAFKGTLDPTDQRFVRNQIIDIWRRVLDQGGVPAGVQNAPLPGPPLLPASRFTNLECDTLYDLGINAIRYHPSHGNVLWGSNFVGADGRRQRAVVSSTGAWRWMLHPSVYDMMVDTPLVVQIVDMIHAGYMGQFNDELTRRRVTSDIEAFLTALQIDGRSVPVVCDATNNPPSLIEQHGLGIRVGRATITYTYGHAEVTTKDIYDEAGAW